MGLLGWLFGAKPRPDERNSKPQQAKTVEVRESLPSILQIPALDFFGLYSRSRNGRYTLVWRDGAGSRGGSRDSGEGRYVLLDGKKLVADGRMQRPNDGKVADNGTFIFNDWRFSSDLNGTFWAFRSDGSLILSRSFSANLFNNGLSAEGTLACCQTCNSASEDSGILAIFDLVAGKEISTFSAESGWANNYEFPPGSGTVRLHYANDGGAFDYTVTGEFIDRDKWISTRLESGDLRIVKRSMEEVGNRPAPGLAKRLIAAVDIGLRHQNWRDSNSQAFGWRLRGEILEGTGAVAEALQSYEKALALNPKVGIKRRVEQLKKSRSKDA